VDETASEDQERVLGKAFSGELGGPLAELANMTQKSPGVERAVIEFKSDGSKTALSAGRAVKAEMTALVGATDRVITVSDSVLALMLGPVGEVNRTDDLKLDVPRHDLSVDLQGVSGTHGRFAYVTK
jgi:hypothetical protein